ncbi:ABC exporter membrane fusion component of DevB family [uncultured Synechococcales cyanobacterium]|uniref:ABC exporter membrane fusion component of DevB family n=1 Tax=uncultured Synechococcales cyanobacterium TaxID=1936017 RepID=A0A6J4VTV6_9CYAN|nr:ABC exporter membrane fusion component of DevB family [uncultured Synechococcales cyanobacterium]
MLQSLAISLSPPKSRHLFGFAAIAFAFVAAGTGYGFWQARSQQVVSQTTTVNTSKITTVTALGRLEPQGEVIKLSAPTSNNGNRVEQLLVQKGDLVKAGQMIAILDNRNRLQAAYEQAQKEVRVAQANLAVTQAGAKQGEINAQRAEIARLEAQRQGDIDAQVATVARLTSELKNAQTEFNRYQSLYQDGAISASNRDSKRLALDTAQKNVQEAKAVFARIQSTSPAQLNQAKANLDQISEVRPVDINVGQADIDRAIAAMNQAKANLDQAYVRSPIDGEVLDIHTRAGEVVSSSDGIVEIGKTQRMYAIAEVYQSDISKVKPGQRVRVTSDSIPGELLGTVERIDSQVKRQTIVNTDPSTNIDARVVEVHVALDSASSQRAAKFTNLQVTAVIEQ